jgi:peptide methionine sulfoxide reductase MsrB
MRYCINSASLRFENTKENTKWWSELTNSSLMFTAIL